LIYNDNPKVIHISTGLIINIYKTYINYYI